MKKVQVFIKPEYFHEEGEKAVVESLQKFVAEYQACPNITDLAVSIKNTEKYSERVVEEACDVLEELKGIESSKNLDFLIKTAEEFCQRQSMFNAIQESIQIYSGESKKGSHAIPELVKNALSVSFDTSVGQEYLDDASKRWEYYTNPVNKVSFNIEAFNKVTNGGIPRKTLNILVAGINVGKTMSLCSLAAMYMKAGLNVLYVSNEMREEEILNRIDANVFNVAVNDIRTLSQDEFMGKIDMLKRQSFGKLYVKEYPTGTASAGNIRHALNELKYKKKVDIDVIICDYLQTMDVTGGSGQMNTYLKYKTVAEELRALMVEFDTIGWTASQFNRGGLDNTDPGMGDTGESTGIPATADGMWALVRTEELDEIGQLLVIELKSRYGNKSSPKFTVGVNIDTMSLYDSAQTEKPIMSASPKASGKPAEPPRKTFMDKGKNKFQDFKVTDD